MEFKDILEAIHLWVTSVKNKHMIKMEILHDTDDFYHVIFETEYSISELVVNKPYFAPYRFVSFLVLDIREDENSNLIYCFYDDKTYSIPKIIEKLNEGIKIANSGLTIPSTIRC